MRGNKRCYRIIDEPKGDLLQPPSPFPNRKQLQKLTKSLMQQHKFMYIDINEDQGFKLMRECDSSDEDEEVEKIGKKYLVNLNNLFTTNSKGLSYIYRFKEQSKKKDHALELLQEELKRSTQKIEKIGKARTNQQLNQTNYNANKTVFERYSSLRQTKQSTPSYKKPSQKQQGSPFFNKTAKFYHTISYDKSAARQNYFSPRKSRGEASPSTVKNILPDLMRLRQGARM